MKVWLLAVCFALLAYLTVIGEFGKWSLLVLVVGLFVGVLQEES